MADNRMWDNRMWLVHRPTGESICLGKRMAWGWHGPPTQESLTEFYNRCVDGDDSIGGQDDFVLAMEDASGAPACTDKWTYDDRDKPMLS